MKHLSRPDEELKKLIYIFVDFTKVEKVEMNLSYLRKIAKQVNKVSKINSNIIIVHTSSNTMIISLAKIAGALARLSGWNFNSFREKKDAKNWLSKKIRVKHGDINLTYSL